MRNITIALVTTLALASTALAQQPSSSQPPSSTPSAQPPASQQPPSQQPPAAAARLTASGQLVRVDTKAKTFTIRAASDMSRPSTPPSDPSRPSTPPSATPPSATPPSASAGSSSASAMPTEFTYNDSTKVSGSEKTVEGLATMQGTEVTVHYVKQADKYIATEIEIKSQQKS
jgi:hypothetical protein